MYIKTYVLEDVSLCTFPLTATLNVLYTDDNLARVSKEVV